MQKISLITGAARGIGAATAKTLASMGHKVCINYCSNKNIANLLVKEIKKNGGDAIAIKADITNENDAIQMFKSIINKFGRIDNLINNAGINGGRFTVEDISIAKVRSVFEINIIAIFHCCQLAIGYMKNFGGNIINISSQASVFAGNNLTAYAASKAAVNTFTVALAREVAKYKIRVNAVSPGIINTDMNKDINNEKIFTLPMQRMGEPSEVANLIAWLLSDCASYISGSIIPITGGR